MAEQPREPRFEKSYRDERVIDGVPVGRFWDIGGPQPAVRELVAHGALRGEVLDPGTGPGHNAIYFASQGYATTGVDDSPAAIELARRNAREADVKVDFEVADATSLQGMEGRFDTVVDSALYHIFAFDESAQVRYAQALHRATRPGARCYLFAFGSHNINGLVLPSVLTQETFERVLPAAGWRVDYIGPSSYICHLNVEVLDATPDQHPADHPATKALRHRLTVLEPLLEKNPVHIPVWSVHATRVD
nr:class I SAM-dependent methyltransferase [Catenulispora rubra]